MSKKFPKNFHLKIKGFKEENLDFLKTQSSFRTRASTESNNNLYSQESTLRSGFLTTRPKTRKLNFNRKIEATPSVDDYLLNQKLFRTWKCL